MSIALNFGFAGRFDLVARKVVTGEDGLPLLDDNEENILTGESRDLASFENLILDSGLNRLGTGAVINGACVGTGTTAPANSQTSLASLLRVTSTQQSIVELAGSTTAPYYAEGRLIYRFAAGTAAGNLSEVGLGWDVNTGSNTMGGLWCRALIKDSGGNPTTITVLSDEVLDIVYTLQLHPPTSDMTGTFNLSGVAYQYRLRPAWVNSRSYYNWWKTLVILDGIFSHGASAFTGGIGAVTSGPSGTAGYNIALTKQTYVNESKQCVFNATADLNTANLAGGIRSMQFDLAGNCWQAEFSRVSDGSTIPKNNTNILTIPFWVSWDRHSVAS